MQHVFYQLIPISPHHSPQIIEAPVAWLYAHFGSHRLIFSLFNKKKKSQHFHFTQPIIFLLFFFSSSFSGLEHVQINTFTRLFWREVTSILGVLRPLFNLKRKSIVVGDWHVDGCGCAMRLLLCPEVLKRRRDPIASVSGIYSLENQKKEIIKKKKEKRWMCEKRSSRHSSVTYICRRVYIIFRWRRKLQPHD